MSTRQEALAALRDLKSLLLASPPGGLDPVVVAERTREVLQLLSGEDERWIGTTEAKRLLGIGYENTVEAWARLGLLRSRRLPNGRVQVLLDDVLHRRAEREGLMAIGGDELSPDQLRILTETRPGKNPWEHKRVSPSP